MTQQTKPSDNGDPLAIRERIGSLRELVDDLRQKAEFVTLTLDRIGFAGMTTSWPSPEIEVDFYSEVRRFQVFLITSALRHTRGSQVKAARLLKMNESTLNTKLKSLNIDCRDYADVVGKATIEC
ncbi:MAG TPA: helix-turn-helix domain-containing protein [Pyrinomonadaceae bacterium]|nr:helix-turn-helix domain-containing protein [Pyrinomonadaceae bacterium]